MLIVISLALLGSALALPQFNQLPQQPFQQQQVLPRSPPQQQQFAPVPQQQPFPAQPVQQAVPVPITLVRRTDLNDEQGNFDTTYEQSNGAKFQESGSLESTNDNLDKVVVKKGFYEYVSPEGLPVRIEYTADRYGFHPSGSVIPVATH